MTKNILLIDDTEEQAKNTMSIIEPLPADHGRSYTFLRDNSGRCLGLVPKPNESKKFTERVNVAIDLIRQESAAFDILMIDGFLVSNKDETRNRMASLEILQKVMSDPDMSGKRILIVTCYSENTSEIIASEIFQRYKERVGFVLRPALALENTFELHKCPFHQFNMADEPANWQCIKFRDKKYYDKNNPGRCSRQECMGDVFSYFLLKGET